MAHRIFATSLSILVLAASASAAQSAQPDAAITDPVRASSLTKVTRDDFKKTTNYQGANASPQNALYLRAWRDDRTASTTFQVYLTSFYSTEWRHYDEAYDSDGNRLDFISINKRVDSCNGDRGCYYEETVGLYVTRKYLEDHQDTGIRYKVSGKTGEFTGFLPAAYVKGFLMSVDKAG